MRLLQQHEGSVRSLAFSPDGRHLASGGKDRRVYLWDVTSGAGRQVFRGKGGFVPAVTFSPDGSMFAFGNGDRAYLFDRATEQLRAQFSGHYNVVTSLSFSPDNGHLVASSQQFVGTNHAGVTRVWNVRTHTEETGWQERLPARLRGWEANYNLHGTSTMPPPLVRPTWSIRLGGEPSALALGTADDGIVLLDWPGLKERASLRQSGARTIVFRPGKAMLASVTESKLAIIWDFSGKKPKKWQLRGHTNIVKCLDYSPDGRLLATGGKDEEVILWSADSQEEKNRFNWRVGQVYALAFAPDGMTMAVAGDEGIALCDVDAS